MTEKRFTMKWNDFMKCNYWLDNDNYLDDCDVTDMLNHLHEENEQLKKEIEDLNWELTEIKKSEDENYEIMDGL